MLKFALNSRRPPAVSSILTQRNVTLTFGGVTDVRQSVLGDWFIKGPIPVNAISPGPTGSGANARNGCMVNPSDKWKNGFDGRINQAGGVAYDDTYNWGIGLPKTLNPGETLIVAISRYPELTFDGLTIYDGGNKRCIQEYEIFHCVDTLPPANAFRPSAHGSTKTIYTTDDVNYSLIGTITPPFDPSVGSNKFNFADIKQGLLRPNFDGIQKISTDTSGLAPNNYQEWYPAYHYGDVNRAAMYTLCNFSDRNALANRIIQIGIDLYGATQSLNWSWRGGAGYAVGRLMPILYAGKLLNNASMLATPGSTADPKFGEQSSWYYATTPYAGYNYPVSLSTKPLYGDIDGGLGGNGTGVDPHHYFNSVGPGSRYTYSDGNCDHMLDAGAYMYISTPVMTASALICRLLGVHTNWNAQASLDFADWWGEDDTLKIETLNGKVINSYYRDVAMNGTGNGFMQQMWDNNR